MDTNLSDKNGMNETPELKPCPFCGSTELDRFIDPKKGVGISCDCGAFLGYYKIEPRIERAVQDWNTRPIEATQYTGLAQMRAQLAEWVAGEQVSMTTACHIDDLRKELAEITEKLHAREAPENRELSDYAASFINAQFAVQEEATKTLSARLAAAEGLIVTQHATITDMRGKLGTWSNLELDAELRQAWTDYEASKGSK